MDDVTPVEKEILKFIENSGGLEKVQLARDGFRNCPDEQRADLIRNIAKTDAGARQLMAAALLGFAIASRVGEMNKKLH